MAGIGRNSNPAFLRDNPLTVPLFAFLVLLSTPVWSKTAVAWDFTKGLHGWQGNKHVQDLAVSAEGLTLRSSGNDPWIEGPAVDLPVEGMTRVRVRMKSDADPHGELFYGGTFQAGRSVRFTVKSDNLWHEYSVLIPEPLGKGTRFRLDPATSEGHVVVSSIGVETLPSIQPPQFERPQRPARTSTEPVSVSSGELTLEHYPSGWGSFIVKVNGTEMAAGYTGDVIGLMLNDQPQWLPMSGASVTYSQRADGSFICKAMVKDSEGGQWQLIRHFMEGAYPGMLVIVSICEVDTDREVVHLPWLTLFPGLGTFGERKTQGLFAGLEYLEDEPSSSMADITTPEHIRRVPDPAKITFPLMAIAHRNRYIGLMWHQGDTALVFDSPDRIYNSGAHVMALTAPAVGGNRFENSLVAHTPLKLKANDFLAMHAILFGGTGETVVPALRKYVELLGLPDVPQFTGGYDAAVTLLAHGWLDSAINEDGLFRHAVWGDSFRAGPAADAPMYMDWLANQTRDTDLADRLNQGRDLALSRIPQGQPFSSAVSHTRTPTAPFIFGNVVPYVEQRKAEAKGLLTQFDAQGIKLYKPGKVDYSKTHFAKHANGHAGADVARILEAATLSADQELIEQGLALLDKQTALYANTVPRGAQVWEVPLHTPDILASAHMVKAYTLGYVLSKKPEYLNQARYWAWTGIPFVYLVNPTEREIGPYATIAVLGATNWQAPSWFGRPVQWCGLVYASALHLLGQYDKEGPWERIATGITATGLQMTWPVRDQKRQGLLPDVFDPRAQMRDGPAINPGTVQAHVPELFDKGTLYDMKRLTKTGWFVHAPCAIHDIREADDSLSFVVDGWDKKAFHILLSGVPREPAAVTIRSTGPNAPGQNDTRQGTFHFNPQQRLLTIPLSEPAEIQLRF